MNEIDFYKLPRAIQDGVIEAFRGRFAPAPIVSRLATRRTIVAWLAVSVAAGLLLAALCAAGFGDVDSPVALHPTAAAAAYVLLAATTAIGVVQALAYNAELVSLPFAPGLFVFPANLIDARDHRLRVFSLAELSRVSAGPRGAVVLTFGGTRHAFPLEDPSRSDDVIREIEAAWSRMRANPDPAELRRLDPFQPPAIESPFASPIPLSRVVPGWQSYAWLLAAAVGVALGLGLFFLRNRMSDARMYAAARARDDVAAYQRYITRGRGHGEVVSQVLLPRAELRLAAAKGSVEAIDDFIRAYPKTGIQAEVAAARRAALAAALDRAREVGTLAALLAFPERYPKHGLDKAFNDARHALYVRALDRYRREMPEGSEQNADFVRRLLAYAERVGPKSTPQGLRGPAVQVRFRRLPSQDLERADELVMKSPMFSGVTSLPTRYVDATRLDPQEKRTATALAEGLARGFDLELVTFEPGPPFEGSAEEQLSVTSPSLVVSYRVESSGMAYGSKKPQIIVMGLKFLFKTEFILPGDAEPLLTSHKIARQIPAGLIQQQVGSPPRGTLEAIVYEAMMREAFIDLGERYLSTWFRKRDEPR
ncbi:hypothetical protein BE20_35810 [Sorangium cellulosum]|uniref:Uncharacterized protein n=1 Tax=Sorangium cellulosum TaxID=56 RepID=A0A150T0K9_SORCE|nr:hypothetical protein BE20_35810 [Sorangium cellulosum]KYF99201.1 hypothetical protein BE18_02060 [Sorangium cellulosum]